MMSMAVTMHPIWQSGAIILIVAVAGALIMQIAVQQFLPAAIRRQHTVLGGAIFSVIGTTYAVLLAFMATTAWEQYSTAETLARHEADLIGSIYRVSFGFPDPAGSTVRADVAAYLEHIMNVEWPDQIAGRTVPASESLLKHLDQTVLGVVPAGSGQSNVQAFLLGALSDVAAARRDRRLAAHGTIPDLVWMVLLAGGALMVGFSFVLGGPAPAVHLLMTATLVASGVLVLLLIVGLSSPFHGVVTIPPEAYAAVLAEIKGAP
jgi:hypothetical protein